VTEQHAEIDAIAERYGCAPNALLQILVEAQ
jgi:hypothetical protein